MKRSKLDKIDRKILLTLQEEGRITNVDLAKKAGISAPPCLRRSVRWKNQASSSRITPFWTPRNWATASPCSRMCR